MIWHALTDEQMEAARMMASGLRTVDVAKRLGRASSTVSGWKRKPEFAETVRLLHRAATAQAVDDARLARTEIMTEASRLARALVNTSVTTWGEDGELTHPEIGTEVVRHTGRAATALTSLHAWYKTLSAQTGVTETTRTVITPADAREQLRADLAKLDMDALEQLVDDDEG